MTSADIINLVRYADEGGRAITTYRARVVLGAKELLVRDPNDEFALEVVTNFAKFLQTGEETRSFAEFRLPVAILDSDEDVQESNRVRAAYLKAEVARHA